MLDTENKRGQVSAGLITGLVFGVASLVIGVIIAFVIVSTLTGANLLTIGRTTQTITNETGWVNGTTYTLDGATEGKWVSGSFSITGLVNNTGNETIPLTNATVSSSGVVVNTTAQTFEDILISYTYTQKSSEEVSADSLSTNFTSGVDNVSVKIPTVLLVAAIVLILGVLVLLVGAWQRMRIGGGSI